jgi:dienelactone hydrolase
MRLRTAAFTILAFILGLGIAGCSMVGGGGAKLERPYLEVRREHATVLTETRRAPEPVGSIKPPAGVEEIPYTSGEFHLNAWLALPPEAAREPVPAIVYCHAGFALGKEDLEQCKPFLAAGYAVLLPSWRGENDNPGHFELLYGEVDDARAAIKHLLQDKRIDKGRVYAFGHSIGGGIAALLSLWDDVPLLATGSAGGLYPYTAFAAWSDTLPFDKRNPLERQLRLLLGNTGDMKRPHFAYIGEEDDLTSVVSHAREEAKAIGAPLTVTIVPGDHYGCLRPAIRQFLRDIRKR